MTGKPYSLRGAGVFSPGGKLLHPSLDDAKPFARGGLSPHRKKRFASEGDFFVLDALSSRRGK